MGGGGAGGQQYIEGVGGKLWRMTSMRRPRHV